ncbi:hypothetical protein OH786_35975 (plasmid) [Streptomyces atratus]|uniref:hypothetical protein n=1 Tax=Streptomyces atratus TaxID=1893 RepID=UPI002F913C85
MQWEVEALEPVELKRLVLAAVSPYTDRDVLARQIAREEAQRRALAAFLDRWDAAGGAAPSWRCQRAWRLMPSPVAVSGPPPGRRPVFADRRRRGGLRG